MPTTMTRVKECPECNGVMKSVWSDGKTRIHAMECQHCGHEADSHKNKLTYLEIRHADAFEELDVNQTFEEFMEEAKALRLESTNEKFAEGTPWRYVKLRKNPSGNFTVAAYSVSPKEGEGAGEDKDLPYGSPDVSWTAEKVYVNGSELDWVNVNNGSAWVYLKFVKSIEIDGDVYTGDTDLIEIET